MAGQNEKFFEKKITNNGQKYIVSKWNCDLRDVLLWVVNEVGCLIEDSQPLVSLGVDNEGIELFKAEPTEDQIDDMDFCNVAEMVIKRTFSPDFYHTCIVTVVEEEEKNLVSVAIKGYRRILNNYFCPWDREVLRTFQGLLKRYYKNVP